MRRAPMSRRGWPWAPAGLKMPDNIPLETFDFGSTGNS